MKAQDLRTKSVEELNDELVNLLGEQFKLRMQTATGQLQQTIRLNKCVVISHALKSILTEKAGE